MMLRIILWLILTLLLLTMDDVLADNATTPDMAACRVDLSSILPPAYHNMSKAPCVPLWRSYLMRYSQTKDNVVTIVVSAEYTEGWVGFGFSKEGLMLDSSVMIGWVSPEGRPGIKQYYIDAYRCTRVLPDQGELPLSRKVRPAAGVHGSVIFLAFQLEYITPLTQQHIIMAFDKIHPVTGHENKTRVKFDFSSGSMVPWVAPTHVHIKTLRRIHGTLAVTAFGFLFPLGVMLARLLKHRRPLWFIIHATIQTVGFLVGVSAVVAGLALERSMNVFISTHKDFGIITLVLLILQVLALITRPDHDSKERKPWNFYHHCIGRLAIFLGATNVFLGMSEANVNTSWRIAYGFLLCSNAIAWFVCVKVSREREEPTPPPVFKTATSSPEDIPAPPL